MNLINSNPNLDCNYDFPIELVPNGIPFGAKTKGPIEQGPFGAKTKGPINWGPIGTHCGSRILISNNVHVVLFNKFAKPEIIVRVRWV